MDEMIVALAAFNLCFGFALGLMLKTLNDLEKEEIKEEENSELTEDS